jgi:two-component system, NarL family, nitrate/nitrite response regulator NarL
VRLWGELKPIVLIVADVRLYREGLAFILERRPDVTVGATAPNCALALEALCDSEPTVALVDMVAPDALDTVGALVRARPELKVVALAVSDPEADMIGLAEAGIAGFVSRDGSVEDLVAAISSAARDEMLCSPAIAASLLRRVRTLAAERAGPHEDLHLTAREIQIVQLIDEGLSNKEIATTLKIEVPTVKHHVHNLLEKLGVSRRAEAAARVRNLIPSARPRVADAGRAPSRAG